MGAAVATDREPRSHRPVASPPGRPVVRRRNGPRSARRRLTLPRSAEGSTIAVAGRASGIQGVSGSRLSQIPRAQAFRTIGGYTDTLIAPTAGGPAGHVPSRKRAQERPSGVRPPVRHFRASGACTLAANGRVDAEVSIGAAALLDSRSCGSLGRCDRARRHCRSRLQSSSRRSTARQRWRLPLPLGGNHAGEARQRCWSGRPPEAPMRAPRRRKQTAPNRPLRKPRSAPARCPRSRRSSSSGGVSRPRPSRLAPPAAELAFGRHRTRPL